MLSGGPVQAAKNAVKDLGVNLIKAIPEILSPPDEDPLPALTDMRNRIEELRQSVHDAGPAVSGQWLAYRYSSTCVRHRATLSHREWWGVSCVLSR